MKNNKKNSPLNQDPKFDTTLHDYGRRAHTMTAKERSDYRTGQKHALTFAPTGGALGVAGKAIGVIKRNIGGGAFSIGQGLVRKFGTKGMKKTYDRVFTPGASQQTTRPSAPKQLTSKTVTPVAKPKTKISKPKPKKIKYQKQYHENEILEPSSGYYRTDAKGWPSPSRNRLAEKAAKLKAAREITGPKGL